MALQAYRHVLRSIRIAFQGDQRMLLAAQAQARSKFEQSRGVSTESEEARKGIEHAESVAVMLRQNIVQGVQETGDAQKYRLRIHDETERGDNDSVNYAGTGKFDRRVRCGS